jgi:UDP-N-acetylmuramoyl-tripeptide--D-alanyl-D-alanine ligase
MKKFSIADLARIIKAHPSPVPSDEQQATSDEFFTGVSIDSRTTKAGDCFFAIPGENFDGHDYVCDAFAKGAVRAVVSKEPRKSKIKNQKSKLRYCLLKVDDTVKTLGDFAREYRLQAVFKVVAITGSVGKTTTRHIANHVLSKHFQ